ncbi:SixA phosphatase family protein [Aestuariirhabdus sp. LZHN29]|uniref:SixA phosphatase family protein n=1 Tax=Aestuariirhabdus sp. LZHN29 TaxID=3417462 RepID=UPI003CEA9458
MKQLLVLRHGKSSWSHPELADIDRPLNKRGKRTTPRMAELIHDRYPDLSLILSSPATRARDTARAVLASFNDQIRLGLEPDLYHAYPDEISQTLAQCGDGHDCVMIVGHNPGLEEWVHELDRDFCDPLPTAGLVALECPIDSWQEITLGNSACRITGLYLPREQFPDL